MRGCSSTTATDLFTCPAAYQPRESASCDQTFLRSLVFDFARRYGWGQAHAESGCELGEGVVAAQVGQGRQHLAAAGQPPPGADLSSPSGQPPPQQPQCGSGQIQPGWVGNDSGLLGGEGCC